MARCEFTDLDTAMCAHCRPPVDEPEPGPAGRWFHAVYPGTCSSCGEPFAPGTPIRMRIPDGWIADCCDAPTW
ncbi:hypothetical protein [Streptomyces sp. STCH 565 A]|uniref:hypothetical protein n=1 Tax=Streptomyces sp. STCH 565 A TaxID=2950532 RepID=UPI002074F990|nr:hypothetical protein [Streptomyces sp. STCH 565 A]MCM8548928.1 hypothetical protein [Streptomyces sp. STCH 565 A]